MKPLENQSPVPNTKLPVDWRQLENVGNISIIWDWENLGLGAADLVPGVTKIKEYFAPRGSKT